MNLILIGAGLVLFVAVSLWRKEWALYLIILLLPSYQIRFTVFGLPSTFLEGMILILALAEFINLLKTRQLKIFYQTQIVSTSARNGWIFLLLVAAGIAIFASPLRLSAAGIFKAYFLEGVLFYFLVLQIIDTPQKLKRLVQTAALLVLYLGLFGIYQFVTLAGLPFSWWAVNVASRRIISLLNHPNALALLLGPLLAMFMALLLSSKTWLKNKLLTTSVIFGLIALYLSFSRAAWLALIVTIAILALLSWQGEKPGERLKKVITYGLLIIVIIFAVPFSRQKLFELTTGKAATQENRYVLWSAAADILKKSPLFGAGLMGFHEAYKKYPLGPDRVVQNYPHNFFLNFWVEIGLLGLLAMLGLLITFFQKIRMLMRNEKWRGLALAAAAGMTMILLHGLVDVPYFKNDLAILFWLIFALPFLPLRSAEG